MLYPRNIKVKFNHNDIDYSVTGRVAQTLLYLVDKQDKLKIHKLYEKYVPKNKKNILQCCKYF